MVTEIRPPSAASTVRATQAETISHLVIEPTPRWKTVDLRELWRYRELLWFLALRDIQVRYKQTALGAAWAILQPLLTMLVFSIFFGRLGGLDRRIGDVPYPLFAFCGLLPWQLFSYALTQSCNSLVSEQRLLTKVYFPRLIIPAAPILSGLLDFVIAFGLVLLMMTYYKVVPSWAMVTLPLFVALAVLTSLAVGLWLSALNAIYRDVRYAIPFLTQFWMFASPIAYPSSIVPEKWRIWYGLNPMVGVVEGFRWALLGAEPPAVGMLCASLAAVVILLLAGLFYFRQMEKVFADVV
jgi:lipopolysaccharide transport system permease protein